jgi:hypothetical protein
MSEMFDDACDSFATATARRHLALQPMPTTHAAKNLNAIVRPPLAPEPIPPERDPLVL